MDLEYFPTNEVAKDMLTMVSPIYDEAYVGKWLYQIMGIAMEKPKEIVLDLLDQLRIETATWTLDYWEEMYSLPPNPALTIEERRRRLLAKRSFRRPLNKARIEMVASEAAGCQVTIVEHVAPFTLGIEIDASSGPVNTKAAIDTVKELKQAHMTLAKTHWENDADATRYFGCYAITVPIKRFELKGGQT